MVGISVQVDDKPVTELIARLNTRINDLSKPLAEVGEYMVSEVTQLFRDSKDPYGKPWKASKRAERDSGKTLVDRASA